MQGLKTSLGWVAILALLAGTHVVTLQNRPTGASALPNAGPPEGWPTRHPAPLANLPQEPDQRPLPKASITEPFGIGEALHDPSRVATGVVSMLAAIGVEIVSDDAADAPRGRARLRLTESEVRALIDMGQADAANQDQSADAPHTFKTLHRVLSAGFPNVSVEQLAEVYGQHYAQSPDSIVPQILLGQPIEPDSAFLRPELWMLLADALLPPLPGRSGMATGPRFVLARLGGNQATNLAGWLSQRMPYRSPQSRWRNVINEELLTRLPLLIQSSMTFNQPHGHEGHGGPGATITAEARLNPKVIRIFAGPAPALVPSQTSLAGVRATWAVDGTIRKHAPSTPASQTISIGADGVARLPMTPKPEKGNGRGTVMSDGGVASLTVDMNALVQQVYGVTSLQTFDNTLTVNIPVTIDWHADAIEFKLTNSYNVGSTSPLFPLHRTGKDYAEGSVALDEDGIYRGSARVLATGDMTLPLKSCGHSAAWQWVDVVGVPIAKTAAGSDSGFYNGVHLPVHYKWITGRENTYLHLEFLPRTAPQFITSDGCQEEIPFTQPSDRPRPNFIPLNDAQWTIAGSGSDRQGRDVAVQAGYAIALPDSGQLIYEDHTSDDTGQAPLKPLLQVGSVDLSQFMEIKSTWYVTVTKAK